MGFLLNLPPPCNVLLQPSSVGISGKPRESPFNISFQKFLKGEVVTPKPVPEPDKYPNMVEEKPLPGKKAYIPPYTPKSALRNSSSFQRSRRIWSRKNLFRERKLTFLHIHLSL